jgi:predicted component of type VI protein secretion system
VIETLQTPVVHPARAGAGAPVSLVLCDLPLANRPADIARIQQLGETGQELQAPVVIALDAGFLGVESLASLAARDNPAGLFQAGSFDAWRSLRDKECARWLVAAVNGFAARAPRKGAAMPAPGDVLWASPVWLVGAAVARAQARTGWPAAHAGLADGEIESLPVFDVSGRDSQYPLQALFPEDAIRQLARAGLTPLLAQPNHDSAWVVAAPVLRRPSRAEEEGKMNTLAWALVAARLGAATGQASRHLADPGDPERTRQRLEQYLQDLLSDTGAGAAAGVSLARDVLQVQLRVGRDILGGLEFTFTLPVR